MLCSTAGLLLYLVKIEKLHALITERKRGTMSSLVRKAVLMGALAALMLFAKGASADSFNFSYSGVGITGMGSFVATPDGGGTYTVTSVTGTQNGATITGMVAVANSGYFTVPDGDNFTYDNLITIGTTPQLDLNGLLFTVQGQSEPVNLYYDTNSYYDAVYVGGASYPNDFVLTPVTFSVAPAPESSSLLLGFGLLGLAWVVRRTSSKSAVPASTSAPVCAVAVAELAK